MVENESLRITTIAAVVHGSTCKKEIHNPNRAGYLHDPEDDSPYDVDGLLYCGRCHWAL